MIAFIYPKVDEYIVYNVENEKCHQGCGVCDTMAISLDVVEKMRKKYERNPRMPRDSYGNSGFRTQTMHN